MVLKDRLMDDLKTSMKNKDKVRKNTITLVRAAITQKEVDSRVELNDIDIIDIISKQVKQRKDSIDDFIKGGRKDLIELAEEEISILSEYLPKQLLENELEEIVKNAIDKTKAKTKADIGKVMNIVMPEIRGKAEGSQVNKIAMKYLA